MTMKSILKLPVKAALLAVWVATVPPVFIFCIAPFIFLMAFIVWLFDDCSEPFWIMYKKEIVDFWEILSFKSLINQSS